MVGSDTFLVLTKLTVGIQYLLSHPSNRTLSACSRCSLSFARSCSLRCVDVLVLINI